MVGLVAEVDRMSSPLANHESVVKTKKKERVEIDKSMDSGGLNLKRPKKMSRPTTEAGDAKRTKISKGVEFEVGNKARTDLGESNPKNRIKRIKPSKAEKAKAHAEFMAKATITKTAGTDKPNWSALKQEMKDKRTVRMKKKRTDSVYEMSVTAKKLWETLRVEKGDHTKTTSELHSLLKTNLSKVIFAHEMSRIVQWMMHLGSADMRVSIVDELLPCIKKMIESKYACKCVEKMLKYGSKESKIKIVDCFFGNIVRLTRNVISAPIVEFAYVNAATAIQQNRMRQEFYSDLFKLSKDDSVKCLADIFLLMPQLKDAHISCTKKNLIKMIEKKTLQSSLFYVVLNDYLQHCPKADKVELLGSVRETLAETLDTEAASEVGMQCIILATNKEKKTVMKSLKGHVVEMAKSKFKHNILLALFDSIDDTVAFGKIVLPEITSNARELSVDSFGRKVVAYLVAHRHASFFYANQCDRLQHYLADSASKKSPDVRQKDIRELASPALLEAVTRDTALWFADRKISLVAAVILTTGSGAALSEAYGAVSRLICDSTAKVKLGKIDTPLIEHPGIHWVLKNLLNFDHADAGRVFCSVLAANLTAESIAFWLGSNRGAFVLVHLLEAGDEKLRADVQSKLRPFAERLKNETSQGAVLLAKKLA